MDNCLKCDVEIPDGRLLCALHENEYFAEKSRKEHKFDDLHRDKKSNLLVQKESTQSSERSLVDDHLTQEQDRQNELDRQSDADRQAE